MAHESSQLTIFAGRARVGGMKKQIILSLLLTASFALIGCSSTGGCPFAPKKAHTCNAGCKMKCGDKCTPKCCDKSK